MPSCMKHYQYLREILVVVCNALDNTPPHSLSPCLITRRDGTLWCPFEEVWIAYHALSLPSTSTSSAAAPDPSITEEAVHESLLCWTMLPVERVRPAPGKEHRRSFPVESGGWVHTIRSNLLTLTEGPIKTGSKGCVLVSTDAPTLAPDPAPVCSGSSGPLVTGHDMTRLPDLPSTHLCSGLLS